MGSRLRDARVKRGLTQGELAERSGIHRAYIGGVERGERNPTLESIASLASAVGVSVGELMRDVDEPR